LAKPVLEMDSRAKVKMRRKVRGLRAIERRVLEDRRQTAGPEPPPLHETPKTDATIENGAGRIPWAKTPITLVTAKDMPAFVCAHPYWLKAEDVYTNAFSSRIKPYSTAFGPQPSSRSTTKANEALTRCQQPTPIKGDTAAAGAHASGTKQQPRCPRPRSPRLLLPDKRSHDARAGRVPAPTRSRSRHR